MKEFHIKAARFFTLVVFSFLALTTAFGQVKLEEGTQVRLKLMQDLSSATAQPGQTVAFEVLDNVTVDNTVVIAEGAPGLGTIVEAEARKSLGRAGKLSFRLEYVKAVDGSKIPIRATSVNQGAGKGVATGVAVGVSALVFFPAAPAFLLIKGKNITVPRGQHIDAFIDGTRTIQTNEENAFSATPAQSGLTKVSNSNYCFVSVVSEPGGADIEVDGVYFGSAPSTIRIPAGQHIITIKRNGFSPWQHNVNLVPGNITLRAELETNSTVTRVSRRRR